MNCDRKLSRYPGSDMLVEWLKAEAEPFSSVVEFGCGTGAYLRGIPSPCKFGIDAFLPYVEEANLSDDGCVFFHGDMLDYRSILPTIPDLGIFIDSIEHLDKDSGDLMLRMCQADFKKVLVFVPVGEHQQEPCEGNIYQAHLSSWWPSDFESLGFTVVINRNFHVDKPPGSRDAMMCRWVKP